MQFLIKTLDLIDKVKSPFGHHPQPQRGHRYRFDVDASRPFGVFLYIHLYPQKNRMLFCVLMYVCACVAHGACVSCPVCRSRA